VGIHQNPVEEMIVINSKDYWYSSARDYCGMKELLKVSDNLRVSQKQKSLVKPQNKRKVII